MVGMVIGQDGIEIVGTEGMFVLVESEVQEL
jgi:hypothetical protein